MPSFSVHSVNFHLFLISIYVITSSSRLPFSLYLSLSLSVPCLVSVVVLLFSVQLSLRALKSCTIDSRYLYFFSQPNRLSQLKLTI